MASLNRALEFALLLSLPAAAALIVMPGPIVAVLFERGAFDATAARATAEALIAFSLGVTNAAVKSRLARARQTLRTELRPQ